MDYMSSIPSSKNENYYGFVVIDKLSKMVIMMPCMKSITIEATAKLLFEATVHCLRAGQ